MPEIGLAINTPAGIADKTHHYSKEILMDIRLKILAEILPGL
jgi:hypothetical protein